MRRPKLSEMGSGAMLVELYPLMRVKPLQAVHLGSQPLLGRVEEPHQGGCYFGFEPEHHL